MFVSTVAAGSDSERGEEELSARGAGESEEEPKVAREGRPGCDACVSNLVQA